MLGYLLNSARSASPRRSAALRARRLRGGGSLCYWTPPPTTDRAPTPCGNVHREHAQAPPPRAAAPGADGPTPAACPLRPRPAAAPPPPPSRTP
eukprot:3864618-Pleurochrysis_carterae.AAC.2